MYILKLIIKIARKCFSKEKIEDLIKELTKMKELKGKEIDRNEEAWERLEESIFDD